MGDMCMQIFDNMKNKEIKSWNAMMNAYGMNGELEKANNLLLDMKNNGIMPDAKTYIVLIHCCSHCGDIKEAKRIWNDVDENIKYNYYLITSLMDCYSRKGQLKYAYNLLLEYDAKHKSDEIMWMSLLHGCCKYNKKQMAQNVYKQMIQKFDTNAEKLASASNLLANTFQSK